MDSVTIGYQPLDLEQAHKAIPAKVLQRKINNDKDLEQEVAEICTVLKDISKYPDWNLNSLDENVGSICLTIYFLVLAGDWKSRIEAC